MSSRHRFLCAFGLVGVLTTWLTFALHSAREGQGPAATEQRALEMQVAAPAPLPAISVHGSKPARSLTATRRPEQREVRLLSAQPSLPESRFVAEDASTSAASSPSADPANFRPEGDLYARWSAERHDPAWTSEMSEYLRETSSAAGLDAASIVMDTDCTTTLCRINLRFDSIDAAGAFQESAQNPDIRYQSMPHADADGWNVLVYVSRPVKGV